MISFGDRSSLIRMYHYSNSAVRPSRRSIVELLLASALAQLAVVQPPASSAAEFESAAPGQRVFSDAPLIPVWMEWLHGHVDFQIERLSIDAGEFRNVRLPLRFEDGAVKVAGASADFAGGRLRLVFTQDLASRRTVMSVQGWEMEAAELPSLPPNAISAPFDFRLKLQGTGRSGREIASTADGVLDIGVREGVIANADLDRVGKDLFSVILAGFNPFVVRDGSTRFDCAQARLEFADGLVDAARVLGLQTPGFDIFCGGTLDFAGEKVALVCRPLQRGSFSSNAPAMVESMEITGSLLEPELRVYKSGLLRQGASLGAGITSKLGVSQFAELLRTETAGRPCELSID